MKATALISQSDYIPWRGYFDMIASADHFILYDDVQYTRRDWRNRNKIKTADGVSWMTIAVESKGKYTQRVCETLIADSSWAQTHWRMLEHAYKKGPYFKEISELLKPLYDRAAGMPSLSHVNRLFLEAICGFLEINTRFHWSTDFFTLKELDAFDKNQRLIELCKKVDATHYISGPSAQDYMDLALFKSAGIDVFFADYGHYEPYPQLHGEFTPYVSILDVLFNTGKKARDFTAGFALGKMDGEKLP